MSNTVLNNNSRADITMVPLELTQPGVIMEFKQANTQQELKQAAQKALAQIQAKDYSTEFVDHPPILQLGIGFCGKHTQVQHCHVP